MAFIIDSYNKYDKWDREHSVYIFERNENWGAIKEVEVQDGLPILPDSFYPIPPSVYKLYDNYEDALAFVHLIKNLN